MAKKSDRQKRIKRNRTISILLLVVLCASMICSLAGCAKQNTDLNADRSTKYPYDFVQYLDAHVYGANGYGFLDIKTKDISVSDFKNEQEYIKVKQALDALNLNINPDNPDSSSNLQASQSNGLKNGDIVTLSIKDNFDASSLGVSMNLEPYKFVVSGLKKAKKVDLFDNSTLDLVGLDDGDTTVYPVKIYGGELPSNMLDQIDYTATVNGDDKIEAGKTILTVNATLHGQDDDSESDDDDDSDSDTSVPVSLATYLGMRGYVAETSGQKVLREMGTPVNFNKIDSKQLQARLSKVLRASDPNFISVANVQQNSEHTDESDAFDYMVIYYAKAQDDEDSDDQSSEAKTACMAANVKIANTKNAGVSVLELSSEGSRADDSAGTRAVDGYTLMESFGNTVVTPTASPSSDDDDDNSTIIDQNTNDNTDDQAAGPE